MTIQLCNFCWADIFCNSLKGTILFVFHKDLRVEWWQSEAYLYPHSAQSCYCSSLYILPMETTNQETTRWVKIGHLWQTHFKGWFPYDRRRSRIADRRSQIAESSAIVCDHMETHFCDRLRSCDRDRRFYLLRSSAIICDRLRSCDHMETKVLRSAIEMYPIIFLILTDDSTFLSHKARMFDYSNAHLL